MRGGAGSPRTPTPTPVLDRMAHQVAAAAAPSPQQVSLLEGVAERRCLPLRRLGAVHLLASRALAARLAAAAATGIGRTASAPWRAAVRQERLALLMAARAVAREVDEVLDGDQRDRLERLELELELPASAIAQLEATRRLAAATDGGEVAAVLFGDAVARSAAALAGGPPSRPLAEHAADLHRAWSHPRPTTASGLASRSAVVGVLDAVLDGAALGRLRPSLLLEPSDELLSDPVTDDTWAGGRRQRTLLELVLITPPCLAAARGRLAQGAPAPTRTS